MENTQFVAERIKNQAKAKKLSVKKMLEKCGLGVNTVNKMANGTDIVSQNLLKIAEELECSVDYLYGRTDNPSITTNAYIAGDNNGVQTVKSGTVTINQAPVSDDTSELVELIQGLSLVQRAKVIVMISEMKSEQ